MSLPNTFIIGAMKSGSTSLHNYLNKHPEVFMSEMKEINYFIEELNFSKGVEWYKSNFKTDKNVIGESSIGYTKRHQYKGVPQRIKDLVGTDLKFIYILRDPIERAKSHFIDDLLYQQLNYEAYPEINAELLKENNIYIETSKYYFQLEAYLKIFEPSQFKIITFEEMKSNPLQTINNIFDFLGVEPLTDEGLIFERVNKTEQKVIKSNFSKRVLNNDIVKGFKKLLPEQLKQSIIENQLFNKISRVPIKKEEYELNTSTVKTLNDRLETDIKQLKDFTKRDFKEWKTITINNK